MGEVCDGGEQERRLFRLESRNDAIALSGTESTQQFNGPRFDKHVASTFPR